jgi:hypothetical protein
LKRAPFGRVGPDPLAHPPLYVASSTGRASRWNLPTTRFRRGDFGSVPAPNSRLSTVSGWLRAHAARNVAEVATRAR